MSDMKDDAGQSASGGRGERILVVSNRYVGDSLLAIPFLRNLRRAHPGAVIDLASSGGGRTVLATCPYLDEIVTPPSDERLSTPARLRAEAAWLASRGYDRVYLLKRSFSAAMVAWLAGIPRRIGISGDFNRLLLTRAVRPRRGRHQVETYLELLRADGVPVDDAHNENWLRAEHVTRIQGLLAPLSADRPRVLLVVQGTDCRRFWNAERWVELMRWLVQARGCELFFCGGPPDAALRATLREAVGPAVSAHLHEYSEALSLAEAGALVARMQLCVSVDTGLVHVAASFHVPVVVLVGPTDPNQWSPWGTQAAVVRSPRVRRRFTDWLAECRNALCGTRLAWPLGRALMDDITVADVQQRITTLLPPTPVLDDPRGPAREPPPLRR
jgi:heptosyltransferase-2